MADFDNTADKKINKLSTTVDCRGSSRVIKMSHLEIA
jgi:hypothetical protein